MLLNIVLCLISWDPFLDHSVCLEAEHFGVYVRFLTWGGSGAEPPRRGREFQGKRCVSVKAHFLRVNFYPLFFFRLLEGALLPVAFFSLVGCPFCTLFCFQLF